MKILIFNDIFLDMNMETINKYNINQLLYNYLYKNDIFDHKIYEIEINNLIISNKKDSITLLLLYFIKLNNINNINIIINNNILFKRDYLNIIKYFYSFNFEEAIKYFNEIINKMNYNLENKDIDFIITIKLNKLLFYLDGYFLTTSIDNNILYDYDYSKLKMYHLNITIINNFLEYIETIIPLNILRIMQTKYSKINQQKKIFIIDAGNIIHSYQGKITEKSILNLKNLTNLLSDYSLLIIIHNKHIKSIEKLKNFLKNKLYFLTPYKYNDDIFILWFFLKYLKNNNESYILSNDKFNDHINKIKINSTIFKQYIINYTIDPCYINTIPNYSKCIQLINNEVIIPHVNNNLVKINLIF
jgi:hypothetical protein